MSNLDSFPLGMGLVAVPGEVIPAKNGAFDGYSFGNLNSGNSKVLMLGLAVLLLFILAR